MHKPVYANQNKSPRYSEHFHIKKEKKEKKNLTIFPRNHNIPTAYLKIFLHTKFTPTPLILYTTYQCLSGSLFLLLLWFVFLSGFTFRKVNTKISPPNIFFLVSTSRSPLLWLFAVMKDTHDVCFATMTTTLVCTGVRASHQLIGSRSVLEEEKNQHRSNSRTLLNCSDRKDAESPRTDELGTRRAVRMSEQLQLFICCITVLPLFVFHSFPSLSLSPPPPSPYLQLWSRLLHSDLI